MKFSSKEFCNPEKIIYNEENINTNVGSGNLSERNIP